MSLEASLLHTDSSSHASRVCNLQETAAASFCCISQSCHAVSDIPRVCDETRQGPPCWKGPLPSYSLAPPSFPVQPSHGAQHVGNVGPLHKLTWGPTTVGKRRGKGDSKLYCFPVSCLKEKGFSPTLISRLSLRHEK